VITIALVMIMSADPSLASFKAKHLEAGKQSTALSKQGKYVEAADLLEKFEKEVRAAKVDLGAETWKFLAEGIAVLRQRAAWAAKSSSDFQSAQKLMLELLNQLRWDVDTAKVQDPRVQELLASARKLDAKTKTLFGPRKVKVVVKAPSLSADQRATYAKGIAADLAALGLAASPTAGGEEFVVTVSVEGPVSAHLIGDDVDECTLKAKGAWKAGGLSNIDLEAHGFGDETTEGDCVNSRIKESAENAARSVLRAWAAK
jgi:hypothetical protein